MSTLKERAISYAKEVKGETYYNDQWEPVERHTKKDICEAFVAGYRLALTLSGTSIYEKQKAFNFFNRGYVSGVKQVAWENTYGGFWQIPSYTAKFMNLPPPTPPQIEFYQYIKEPEVKIYFDEAWAKHIEYYCIKESKLIKDKLSTFNRHDDLK